MTWVRVLAITTTEVGESEDTPDGYHLSLVLSGQPQAADSPCGEFGLTQTSGPVFLSDTTSLPHGPSNCLQIYVADVRGAVVDEEATTPPGFTMIGAGSVYDSTSNGGIVHMSYRVTQPGDTGSVPDYGLGGDR